MKKGGPWSPSVDEKGGNGSEEIVGHGSTVIHLKFMVGDSSNAQTNIPSWLEALSTVQYHPVRGQGWGGRAVMFGGACAGADE